MIYSRINIIIKLLALGSNLDVVGAASYTKHRVAYRLCPAVGKVRLRMIVMMIIITRAGKGIIS